MERYAAPHLLQKDDIRDSIVHRMADSTMFCWVHLASSL